ncbi:hypothetical protein CEK25_004622 [Fusarium fujikuroi]|nr:hypothetical protein CEK25_004622 [Fusarium fujikuroi]
MLWSKTISSNSALVFHIHLDQQSAWSFTTANRVSFQSHLYPPFDRLQVHGSHNPNNWHWVNKDVSSMGQSYFDESSQGSGRGGSYFDKSLTKDLAGEDDVSGTITVILSIAHDTEVRRQQRQEFQNLAGAHIVDPGNDIQHAPGCFHTSGFSTPKVHLHGATPKFRPRAGELNQWPAGPSPNAAFTSSDQNDVDHVTVMRKWELFGGQEDVTKRKLE